MNDIQELMIIFLCRLEGNQRYIVSCILRCLFLDKLIWSLRHAELSMNDIQELMNNFFFM